MKTTLKFFYILLFGLFFSSCSHLNYQVNYSVIDYTAYSVKGFFITEATSVNFEYQPIGSIMVESVSGLEVIGKHKTKAFDSAGNIKEIEADNLGKLKLCNIKDAFEKLHQEAVKTGANGIINVKVTYQPFMKISYETYPSRWIVTGMLIKK